VQWSKGDYANSTNKEDDMAKIIALLGRLPDETTNATCTTFVVAGPR
jgi:hypothetical protein